MSSMGTDADRLLVLVRALAEEMKPGARDFSALGHDHRLERDFGLDSLARVELLARIERELDARLGEAAFTAETPADLLRLIGDAPRSNLPVTSVVLPTPTSADFVPPPDALATLTEVLDWHVRISPIAATSSCSARMGRTNRSVTRGWPPPRARSRLVCWPAARRRAAASP